MPCLSLRVFHENYQYYCNDIAQNYAATNTVELLFLYHTLYKQKQKQTQTQFSKCQKYYFIQFNKLKETNYIN